MTALNETTFAAGLAIKYRRGIEKAVLEKSPFCASMNKKPFPESQYNLALRDSHSGASPVFSVAQGRKAAATPVSFAVTRTKLYVLKSIDGETDEAAGPGATIAPALDEILDQGTDEFAHAMSWNAWNGQGGAVGQISDVTTTAITLTNVTDAVNFNVLDELEFSTTNTASSTAHSSGATATVTAITRRTGVLTSDSNWSAQVSAIANNDFIFKEGCTGNMAAGVLAWVPDTASPAALFGVTRTTDRERRAGVRYDATGLDVASAVIQARARGVEVCASANFDLLVLGPRKYADFEMSLEGKAVYTRGKAKTSGGIDVGFDAIRYGKVMVMEDPFCPNQYGLLTSRDNWNLGCTRSGIPHFDETGGGKLHREPNADAAEYRMRAFYNMWPTNPGKNVLICWNGLGA